MIFIGREMTFGRLWFWSRAAT